MSCRGAPGAEVERSGADGSWPAVRSALLRASRALRRRATATAGLGLLAAASGLFLALTLVPRELLEGRGSPLPLAASLLFGCLVLAGAAWAARARRDLEPGALSGEAERAAGLSAGELAAALELETAGAGESPALARLHRERVGGSLAGNGDPFPRATARWRRRLGGAAAVAAGAGSLLAITAAVRPDPSAAAVRALAGGWRTAFPPALPPLTVRPGEAEVPRGGWLEVRVHAPGRERATLAWRPAGERPRREELRPGPDGWATSRLGPVEAPARYWASAPDGAVSDTFAVRPLEALFVEALRVRVRYPAHLEREPEVHEGPVPELIVPEGSRLLVEGRANRPLRRASLRGTSGGPDAEASLSVDGARFSGVLRPVDSGRWRWQLEAAPGSGAAGVAPPEPLTVQVVRDEPPTLVVVFPGRDTLLGSERVLPLVVDARDDIGLRRVELASWERRPAGAIEVERVEELPRAAGVRRAVLRPALDLRNREVLPGDTVYYLLRAYDGDPGHGPAVTDTFRVGIATLPELRNREAGAGGALATEGRHAVEAADSLARAAREAGRQVTLEDPLSPSGGAGRGDPELGFEATQEGRGALGRGREMERRLSGLEAEARRLAEALASAPLSDPRLGERLRRLEALYRELRESALGARLERLEEALRELDRDALREALEALASGSDELRGRLERSLALLERAALEQEVTASRAEAERLATEQRSITEAPPAAEEWVAREARLGAKTTDLADRLDRLERRLAGAAAPEAARASGEAGEHARAALGAMEDAAGAMEAAASADAGSAGVEESGGAASRSAQRAGESLERAGEALGRAQGAMDREWQAGALEALRTARREALFLAEEEGELAERLFGEYALAGTVWQGRQAAVREAFENLLRSLAEAGRRTALVDERVGPLAAEVGAGMDAILGRLAESGGRRRPFREETERVTEGLNELALRLLASEEAVRAAGSPTGAREARERVASLAARQQGLARRTGALATPGPGSPKRSQELRELAEDQADVGRGLRRLPDAELLGRPEEMAQEAERLGRRLAAGLADQETLAGQRRLFRRMLDAGRSLEDDELDPTRRESRTGRPRPAEIPSLDPSVLAGPRFPHPAEALLGDLPAAYRRLVFEYFDRLNGRPGEGGRAGTSGPSRTGPVPPERRRP